MNIQMLDILHNAMLEHEVLDYIERAEGFSCILAGEEAGEWRIAVTSEYLTISRGRLETDRWLGPTIRISLGEDRENLEETLQVLIGLVGRN
jgi:hypothetical protein